MIEFLKNARALDQPVLGKYNVSMDLVLHPECDASQQVDNAGPNKYQQLVSIYI